MRVDDLVRGLWGAAHSGEPLTLTADDCRVLARSHESACRIVDDLRRKLAEAGVEGSPPPWETLIARLTRERDEARAEAARLRGQRDAAAAGLAFRGRCMGMTDVQRIHFAQREIVDAEARPDSTLRLAAKIFDGIDIVRRAAGPGLGAVAGEGKGKV